MVTPSLDRKVKGKIHLSTLARKEFIHDCRSLVCEDLQCSVVLPDTDEFYPGHSLAIAAFVEVAGSSVLHQCAERAHLGFSGFGCDEGTILAFLGALCGVVSGTIILGLIFEFFFHNRTDFFVQASLKIQAQRSELANSNKEPPSTLWPLPTLKDLHQDVQCGLANTVGLPPAGLPLSRMRSWSTGCQADGRAEAVQLEFQIPRLQIEVEDLRKQLLGLSWFSGESWATSNIAVESQPPACVKEIGALPGADLMDAIEGCIVKTLSCCSRTGPDPSDHRLHLEAARQVLATLMTRHMAIAISLQTLANMVMIMLLPAIAASSMKCEDGFPDAIHAIWGVYILCSSIFGSYIMLRPLLVRNSRALTAFISKFRVRLLLRWVGMLVSVTDLYQDTCFPVIAGKCGFDLWWVSLWLVFIGVGVMQIIVQMVLIFNCWRRYRRARTAEERERVHIEGIFLALRGCDNHVLVYAAKPAIEERLGGHSSWAIKTVEARVAFLRFCFEDAEQSALQVIFLYWFESASLKDKLWVAFSVGTSLVLSFTLTVQTLPEVRDWIWYQFLTAFPGGARFYVVRLLWLFFFVGLYRLFTAFPWLGACTPAGDHDDSTLQRLLLLSDTPVPTTVLRETFAGCAIAFFVALFMTALSMFVWNKPLGFSRRWRQWRGTLPLASGTLGTPYDFHKRLAVADGIHIKTESDEDLWLEHLRVVKATEKDPLEGLLLDIDRTTYELVHTAGLSGMTFHTRRMQVSNALQELESRVVSKEAATKLRTEVDRSLDIANTRRRALELLADRTFRHSDLFQKHLLIHELTGGEVPLRLLHWSVIAELKELPRCGVTEKGAVTPEQITQNKDSIVVIYFSHTWTRRNHPDSEMHLKARTMVQFAQWMMEKAGRVGIACDVFFWVDYSCLDTEVNLDLGLALLPLFVASCTDILMWRTPDYESRCWTMVERLLAYCFCPGGLTPYAMDGTSFNVQRMLESQQEAPDEPSKDFSKLYKEMSKPTKRAQTVPLEDGETPVHRQVRKLPDPLDSMVRLPSGTALASFHRRNVQKLVDMALAVPALEVFGDRQPVEFGLTEVVEQVLGDARLLDTGFGDKTGVTVAWSATPSDKLVPGADIGKIGSWLKLEGGVVKEVAEWRLVVEPASHDLRRKTSFAFRPGDDEGVITLVDDPNKAGEPSVSPGADEINRLFSDVNTAHEDHLRGAAGGSQLEKAATSLAKALKDDLQAALRAAEKDGDEQALRQAVMRTRDAELPEKRRAMERLNEIQMGSAIAAGDIIAIRMAMRDARAQGLDHLPQYGAAEAALAHLSVQKLRANALSVVHEDGANILSIVSVVGVAKAQGWHDIAHEALSALETRITKADGGVDIDTLVAVCGLGQSLSIDAVSAMTKSILARLLEDMKRDKRSAALLVLIKTSYGGGCDDMGSLAVAALESIIDDHWGQRCCGATFVEAREHLSSISGAAQAFIHSPETPKPALEPLQYIQSKAQTRLEAADDFKSSEMQRIRQSVQSKKSDIDVATLLDAVACARTWGWDDMIQQMEQQFVSDLISPAAKKDPVAAASKLSSIYEVAREHKLNTVVVAAKEALANCLAQARPSRDPVMLFQMFLAVEASGSIEVAGQIRLELQEIVAALKDSDEADAEERLAALHHAAADVDQAEIADLAGEAAGAAAAKEEARREEAQNLLAAAANTSSVVEIWGTASRRGWTDIAESAAEALRSHLTGIPMPLSDDDLFDLAQASAYAEKNHVRPAAQSLDEIFNRHLQDLDGSGNAAGILKTKHTLEEAECSKVVVASAHELLDSMMREWKKVGVKNPPAWASDLQSAASRMDATLAAEIGQILALEDRLMKAKASQDLETLGSVAREALKTGCNGDYQDLLGYFQNHFQNWKATAGAKPLGIEERDEDLTTLTSLHDALDGCSDSFVDEVGKVLDLLEEAENLKKMTANKPGVGVFVLMAAVAPGIPRAKVKYKAHRGKRERKPRRKDASPPKEPVVLPEALVDVATEAEKLGVSFIAGDARECLKQIVKSLEKDVVSEYNRNALQELHDVAREANLDDVADLAVDAVGGNLPKDWVTNGSHRLSLLEKVPSTDKELIARIQELVDQTYRGWGRLGKDCSTRDRHKLGNPQGAAIKVEEVVHVENAVNYLNFIRRRTVVENEFQALADKGRDPHIKTWAVSLQGLRRYPTDPVDKSLNECWLWHGTSEAGVNGITDTDFDMARAGKHVGTMFGRGIYFTESTLKADEYTKADARGFCPLLLCRVVLGHYYYCDAKAPWDMTETLERACKGGGYHAVLGDRERVRGTYREFVVFDNDQIYPEYIVWYSRLPPFKEFK